MRTFHEPPYERGEERVVQQPRHDATRHSRGRLRHAGHVQHLRQQQTQAQVLVDAAVLALKEGEKAFFILSNQELCVLIYVLVAVIGFTI